MTTKKIPIYLLLCATIIASSSCSILNVANPTIEPIVFTKPMHRDTAFTTSYVGGKYSNTQYLDSYTDLLENNLGQVNLYQTYTRKFLNASYGGFAYVGSIKISDYLNNHPENSDNKNYYGFGATADVQLNLPFGNFALRPLGARVSALYENGEYANYKNNLYHILSIKNNYIATSISQTFGADYYFKKSSIGFNFSAGFQTTYPTQYFDFGYSSNIVYTYDRLSMYLQQSGHLLLQNSDFVVGVSYRFAK
jgi:hypothetical protein